jgi:16S rRNA (cytosine967-C5)-methyltransferase
MRDSRSSNRAQKSTFSPQNSGRRFQKEQSEAFRTPRNQTQVESARGVAFHALYNSVISGILPVSILHENETWIALSRPDKGLAEIIVRGVEEKKSELDSDLNKLIKMGLQSVPSVVAVCLRIGLYQVKYLTKIPNPIAVFETVELSKLLRMPQGHINLINGVLREYLRQNLVRKLNVADVTKEEYASKFPVWLKQLWVKQLGEVEAQQLERAHAKGWPLSLRVNTIKVTREELIRLLAQEKIQCRADPYHDDAVIVSDLPKGVFIHESNTFEKGLCYIQDVSSMYASTLLNVEAHDSVVDLCCAPGGKLTHILEKLHSTDALVVGLDKSKRRIKAVIQNIERLELRKIQLKTADILSSEPFQTFSKVLLDAPCSGLGMIGRKSDISSNKTENELKELPELQKKLLACARTWLQPGGVLVYSTCTTSEEENESVIDWFLKSYKDFYVKDISGQVDPIFLTSKGFFRSWPHKHAIGGSFVAVLQHSN